jgi:hypothetical protein
MIISCLNYEESPDSAGVFAANYSFLPWYWSLLAVLCASLLACLSRVYLGVHYPSDCVAGLVFAVLILLTSAGLYQIPLFECKACTDECHSSNHIQHISELNWVPISVVFCVGTLISFIITMKPIAFWKKNGYVFG